MEFVPFPKMPRLKRAIVITEKIDGTNAQVVIERVLRSDQDTRAHELNTAVASKFLEDSSALVMWVGSRSRWITPGKETDNFGFAAWCRDHSDELFKLGEGQHFGEWYGSGIQRGYGLDHKRFALFNTARWGVHNPNTPACCEVVPVLEVSELASIEDALEMLRSGGSRAAPGFMKPEGVVVYHTAAKSQFKVLLENDDIPKGVAEAQLAAAA
jgi:hypothetical protein